VEIMKAKHLVIVGAFIGVFLLGILVGPIFNIDSDANTMQQDTNRKQTYQQTTMQQKTGGQMYQNDYICPMTGQPLGMGMYFSRITHEKVAEMLDMSSDDLYTARTEGKSLADLAKEKEIPLDRIEKQLLDIKKEQLDRLLEKEVITETQMQDMLERIEKTITQSLERKTTDSMNPARGMMGHHRQWQNKDNMQEYWMSTCPYWIE